MPKTIQCRNGPYDKGSIAKRKDGLRILALRQLAASSGEKLVLEHHLIPKEKKIKPIDCSATCERQNGFQKNNAGKCLENRQKRSLKQGTNTITCW